MKYKIPKGTDVSRCKRYLKPEADGIYWWTDCVTTKNAYYTEKDIDYDGDRFITFEVPCSEYCLVMVYRDKIV